MFFNSIEEKSGLRKEIDRLLSKGLSNIYLHVAFGRSQNFNFLSFKSFTPGQFW